MGGPQINTLRRIDSVHMAISVDDDGTEGVIAILVDGSWVPLLAADADRLPFILEGAEFVAKRDRRLVRIIRLAGRVEVSEFDGRS